MVANSKVSVSYRAEQHALLEEDFPATDPPDSCLGCQLPMMLRCPAVRGGMR
jgi:hypothetical protein